ncbi:MAG: MATE family efflux transporter [Clostridiales bacterium]|nr:MATE family efflux transporter [Clostridiales bacterium]
MISNKEFFKKITFIALPIAIQSVIASSLSLVDNLMVGRLGEAELAAVGIATQIYFVHWMLVFGFTSGVSTYMAQFLGAKDERGMKKTIGIALAVCFSVSVIFFLVAEFFSVYVMRIFTSDELLIRMGADYIKIAAPSLLTVSITVPFQTALRVTKQTHIPLFISIAVFSTNTFLNYCLIFGNFGMPKLGVSGASLATMIARTLEILTVLTVVFVFKNRVAAGLSVYFSWSRELFLRVIRNAVPTMLNETIWGLGNAMYVAAYARLGVTAYAAVQVGTVINSLFSMAGFSLGDAALILVGEKLGEGDTKYALELGNKILKTAIVTGIIFGIGLIAVSQKLVPLFDLTEKGREYAIIIIAIDAIFLALVLYNGICVVGLLRAGGDTLFAMLIETGSIWLYAVPMAFATALLFHLPVYLVMFCVKTEEILKCAILTKRVISQKWVKNVVSDIAYK